MADDFYVDGFLDSGGLEPMDPYVDDLMFASNSDALFGTDERGEEVVDYVEEDVRVEMEEELMNEEEEMGEGLGSTAEIGSGYGFEDAVKDMFGGGRQNGLSGDMMVEDIRGKLPPQALKRKRSGTGVQQNPKRVAIESSFITSDVRKEDEIPASVLSDFTIEDQVEKQKTISTLPQPASPEEPRSPGLTRLVVNKDISPDTIDLELSRPVDNIPTEDVTTTLQTYYNSLRRLDAFENASERPTLTKNLSESRSRGYNGLLCRSVRKHTEVP